MKVTTLLTLVIATLLWSTRGFTQERQDKVDSLIVQFKAAGRDWNIIADQLIHIGEPAVLPLVDLLMDSSQSQWTRRIAAMTLNDIHSPSYIEPAKKILFDRDETLELRNHVTNGLKGYDLSDVSDDLMDLFREEDNVFFRLNIAGILDTSDPILAYQAYEELFQSSDGYCRQQALKNLVRLRPQESSDWYMSALQTGDWMTANLAMDSLKTTSLFSPNRLIRIYHRNDTPEIVRWRIIHVMGHRPERNYMELQLEALQDPGWLVHNEAALALSRMPRDLVLPELRYLEQFGETDHVNRAAWVIRHFEEESDQAGASMQPFGGYPLFEDMEDIKKTLENKCIDTITFRRGEMVADVGAANGYLEAMLSLFHDDLTFYIQDIDPIVCNPNSVKEVVSFYEQVNGRPFTNRFIPVIGTDTETNLPDHTFDKVLMLWTYQYLKNPREFIINLRQKMKNGGLFYVINPGPDYEYGKLLSVEHGWNMSPVEKQISDIIDCGFELIKFTRNYDNEELPYMMVFKKK